MGVPINHDYSMIDVIYPEIARAKLGIVEPVPGPPVPATTDDLPEGTENLYWTQARFDSALADAPAPPAPDPVVAGQTEIDFGPAIAVNSATFHVNDASVTPTSRIQCWLAGEAPSGRTVDEALAEEPLKLIATPGLGGFGIYVEQPLGALNDTFKINYVVF